jgi:hypothetical protein
MKNIIHKYVNGSEIHAGQRVIYNGQVGTVVFIIEHDEYLPEFPKVEWLSIESGFMIRFDNGALLRLEEADELLSRDKNETA